MTRRDKIRALREDRDLSQAELTQHVEVSTGHINRLENGRHQPSVELEVTTEARRRLTAWHQPPDTAGHGSPTPLWTVPRKTRADALHHPPSLTALRAASTSFR